MNKKLPWTEYLEECYLSGDERLCITSSAVTSSRMSRSAATMHINRKPAEQAEVDWAGDLAHIIDPDTGENLDAHIFVES